MKTLLSIAFTLTIFGVNAQFFQHKYGTTDLMELTHGFNTDSNGVGFGHFMTGNTFTSSVTMPLAAVFTNTNGIPAFQNTYAIQKGSVNQFVNRARAFEFNAIGGRVFGIVAEMNQGAGTNNSLLYATLDISGNILTLIEHTSGNPSHNFLLGNVLYDPITTDAFAIGTLVDISTSPNDRYIFAYRFNPVTGAIVWSNYYDYINAGGQPQFDVNAIDVDFLPFFPALSIVGGANGRSFLPDDNPVYLEIDIPTGALTFPSHIYDMAPGSNDEFTAIDWSAATGLFAISGQSDLYGQRDAYTMLLAPPFIPVWGTMQQYNGTFFPNQPVTTTDVLARTNQAGNPEFYTLGTVGYGNIAKPDIVVYKLDVNLTPTNQFTYGDIFPDDGVSLDGYNGTSAGLSVYGNYSDPSPVFPPFDLDFYHVKAYYSGQSGTLSCMGREELNVPIQAWMPFPVPLPHVPTVTPFLLTSGGLTYTNGTLTDASLCFTTSIPGGSNARVSPLEEKTDREAKLSPNPISQGSQAILLEVNTEVPVMVNISIHDMLGRDLYNIQTQLESGDNRLPLGISDVNLSTGTYTVKIQGIDFNKHITLLVK